MNDKRVTVMSSADRSWVIKPTLCIDIDKCVENIDRMISKVKRHKLELRPHFKTHQSLEIAEMFRERGVSAITVSSVDMAVYFANAGWNDITIAFPVNVLECDAINELASRINLNIILSEKDVLDKLLSRLNFKVGLFIKIDIGYHRAGIMFDDFEKIDDLLNALVKSDSADRRNDERCIEKGIDEVACAKIEFKGFLTHAGHTYHCKSAGEVASVHKEAMMNLQKLKERYISRFPNMIISYGDTPSSSLADDFSAVDELRPGNFVFYDLTQYYIGVCNLSNIAVSMACPIVEIHKERNEFIVYGGGVHFTKEFLIEKDGSRNYGLVYDDGNVKGCLVSLSQEHGIVKADKGYIDTLKIGDVVDVLPVHSCMTADIMKRYYLDENRYFVHL